MGWLFGWDSKKELIEHLERESAFCEGYTALKHSTVGNNHWSLVKKSDGKIMIFLELMSGSNNEWGYKSLSEDCGPVAVNCPISFIKAASETDSKYANEWRAKVLKEHAAKKNRPNYLRGQIWKVFEKEYELMYEAGKRKGWVGKLVASGEQFRIPSIHLSKGKLINQG